MNTETGEVIEHDDMPEQSQNTAAPGSRSSLSLVIVLLSLAAFITAAGGIYVTLQLRSRVPDIDPLQARLLDTQAAVNTASARLQGLERELQQLRQQQETILRSLASLNSDENYTLDSVLVEVENLLVIASQRLILSKDVPTALAAMQSAEDRLRNFNEPLLIQFRQVLTADINALHDVEAVDITGLALYLADIATRVQSLPLRQPGQNQGQQEESSARQGGDGDDSVLSRLGDEVVRTLKDLVKVYPSEGGAVITLLPEQQYYLYQNLRLQIEIARLAVMRGETENFHASIKAVMDWLETYFKTSDRGVGNIIASLSSMQSIDLDPGVPDISSSMESLRALIRLRPEPGRNPDQETGNPAQ